MYACALFAPPCLYAFAPVLPLQRLRARGMPPHEVSSIVEMLTNEGVIYSTIDEYHYKLTGE